jgi:hypothetical protein
MFVVIFRAIIFDSCQMDVHPLVLQVSPSSDVVLSGERLCRQPQRGMGRLLTNVMCRQPLWGRVDCVGGSALDASLNRYRFVLNQRPATGQQWRLQVVG